MIRRCVLGLVTACVSLVASQVQADGMRCGTKLASDGDSTHEVRSICGDPAAAQQRVEHRTVRRWVSGPCVQFQGQLQCGHMIEHTVQVVIDEWTYDFGPHQFIRYVTFEQGKLMSVVTGGYGKGS
jgi:hypothetical protein